MDELAGLVAHLRAARREVAAARARVSAHLRADGERRLEAMLAKGVFDPLTCANRAWMEAHTSPELERLNDLAQRAQDLAWELEHGIVGAVMRLCPGE